VDMSEGFSVGFNLLSGICTVITARIAEKLHGYYCFCVEKKMNAEGTSGYIPLLLGRQIWLACTPIYIENRQGVLSGT
jgi:hypothetical protein